MVITIAICAGTCLLMILSILFFPKMHVGKLQIDTYWIVTTLGAIVLLAATQTDLSTIGAALAADTAVNPIKILALFLSLTALSVYLDEMGFFRYLANATLKKAGHHRLRLFFYLYAMVSVLTIFTSNDIIVLSFTPFICYFCKNARIDPLPYLAAEFVAANTWSLALIIGNPTNIYLASSYGLDFVSYMRYSMPPTLAAGLVGMLALYLLFRKKFRAPSVNLAEEVAIEDKGMTIVAIVHIAACSVLLAISSYLHVEMWEIAVISVASLVLATLVAAAIRRKKPSVLLRCLKRIPYELVPFVLSMFVMITVMTQNGVTEMIAELLGMGSGVWTYGIASFFACNVINNIPMSVLFSSVAEAGGAGIPAVMATIVGSNLGALLTPIGALAGIMWGNILHSHGVKFGYAQFLKMGAAVAVPSMAAALAALLLTC